MEPKPAPLSDLSFFRFPEVTPEIVRNILFLLLLLALTILLTVIVQRWIQERSRHTVRRRGVAKLSSALHMEKPVRDVLARMMRIAGVTSEYDLARDAESFEAAAENLAAQAGEEELIHLHRLRRVLRMNVMNPELALISTRQLLRDLPIRLLANVGSEKLDLYCSLLEVNEQDLLIDLPYHEDIYHLLSANPEVFLLHWREQDGETVFRIRLEPVGPGQMSMFRATHAMRSLETAHRAAFRLSVDVPVAYTYLDRAQLLARRKGGEAAGMHAVSDDGHMVDLSYGGASFSGVHPLAPGGFAQLRFVLHGQPLRLMLAVLSCTPQDGGGWLVRGQFRGLSEDVQVRLHNLLSREQIKRLREKEILHFKPEV